MRLLLIRHGESTWNVQGRYQGRKDPPLSPLGRQQAHALAMRLRRDNAQAPISRIVSSPLRRAYDTALPCVQAIGSDLIIDERLIEISHGQWEGLLRSEVAQRWPTLFEEWQTAPQLVRFPGGESLHDVQMRFESFLRSQADSNTRELAVTHDVIVRLAVLMAAREPLSAFHGVQVENASLNEFELKAGTLRAISLNDIAHLASLRSQISTQAL